MKLLRKALLSIVVIFFVAGNGNAAGLENGTVLNVGGEKAFYYYINGYAAHIPSPPVYQCLELEKHPLVRITQAQLENMPKTAFLIRASDGQVYRVDGDTRRRVPNSDVFKKLGFNEEEVIDVTDEARNCIKNGPRLR